MPRVKLSEFRAKTIVNNYFETPYAGISIDTSSEDTSVIDKSLKPDTKYVVKVDQGIKKRFKQGLVKLDLNSAEDIKNAIADIQNKGFNNFLIEELIPHEEVMKRFSTEERERIEQKARYLIAAMELRRLRQKARYSQEKLAKKMKVKREFISRIESGTQNVTLETLYRIGAAMGKEFHFAFK